jgi:sulfate transport system permease protein
VKRLALASTLLWLGLIVLVPVASVFVAARWNEESLGPRAISAIGLTFAAALVSAVANGAIGLLLAWILVRYQFPGKRLLDGLIDVPFALPTAVTGLTFASLYHPEGWLGRWLAPLGISASHSRLAIVIVLTFVSLPFVVRAVGPVLEELGADADEAAHSLGATRWQTFRLVTFPAILPALLTGVALAFARAVGEYGSVVFVSGNIPHRTEIASVLIVGRLEQFQYGAAAATGAILLGVSLTLSGAINLISARARRA